MCIHREIHTIWKRHNDFETAQTMEFIRFAETETSLFFEKYTHLGRKIPNLQNYKKKSTFDHFDQNARIVIKKCEMSGDLTYDMQLKN